VDNIAGPPVEGDNFFGREAETQLLWEALQNHDVLLLGPRRVGKTSLARALMRCATGADWDAIEVNVASCPDEMAFVEKLARAVEALSKSKPYQAFAALVGRLTDLLKRVRKVGLPVPGGGALAVELDGVATEDWSDVASDTLRLIGEAKERWLIYIDELPIFLYTLIRNDKATGIRRARRFLDWFRNDLRAIPECRLVRWLITGSVGLDTLVQRHSMADTINSLKHARLEPYTEPVAVEMVKRLAHRYQMQLELGEAQALVCAVGWPQPYYLQLVFNRLRYLCQSNPGPVGQLIGMGIERAVQPGEDNDFHHWKERLFVQLDERDGAHAVALLTRAAADVQGAASDTWLVDLQQRMPDDTTDRQMLKFFELRDILIRDAYWEPHEVRGQRRYRFRLELLRRWWLRRYSS
jgi:hypothetical protein